MSKYRFGLFFLSCFYFSHLLAAGELSSAQKLAKFRDSATDQENRLAILREMGQKYPGLRCEEGFGLFGFDYQTAAKHKGSVKYQAEEWSFPEAFVHWTAYEYLQEADKKITCNDSPYSRELAEVFKEKFAEFTKTAREVCESWNGYHKVQASPAVSDKEKQRSFWRSRQRSYEAALQVLQSKRGVADAESPLTDEWSLNAKMQSYLLPELNMSTCGELETPDVGSSLFDRTIAGLIRVSLIASDSEEDLSEDHSLADHLAQDIIKPKVKEREPASK